MKCHHRSFTHRCSIGGSVNLWGQDFELGIVPRSTDLGVSNWGLPYPSLEGSKMDLKGAATPTCGPPSWFLCNPELFFGPGFGSVAGFCEPPWEHERQSIKYRKETHWSATSEAVLLRGRAKRAPGRSGHQTDCRCPLRRKQNFSESQWAQL